MIENYEEFNIEPRTTFFEILEVVFRNLKILQQHNKKYCESFLKRVGNILLMETKQSLNYFNLIEENLIRVMLEVELELLLSLLMPNREFEKSEVYKKVNKSLKVQNFKVNKKNYRNAISKKIRTAKLKYNFVFNSGGYFND